MCRPHITMRFLSSSRKLPFALAIAIVSVFSLCQAADEAYTGTPYGGKPQEIPGIIHAQNYDVAPNNANGVAYNRKGTPKPGPARTTGDCIGFGKFDGSHVSATGEKVKPEGYYVGWTDPGDWWKYTVKVNEAGTYNFGGHLAAGNAAGAKISVTFTPLNPPGAAIATGVINVPTSVGLVPGVETYHVWQTLDKLAQVKLTPGLYVMTVKIEATGGMNLDYYTLAKQQ